MNKSIGNLTRSVSIVSLILLFSTCNQKIPLTLPEFSMRLADSTQIFHSKNIPFGKTSVVIWFDPACRECQLETEFILANMDKFKELNFYLVTRNTYDEMMVFHDHLKLESYNNIKIGIDSTLTIPQHFNVRTTPLTVVLNEEKIVTAVFSGKPNNEKFINIVLKKNRL